MTMQVKNGNQWAEVRPYTTHYAKHDNTFKQIKQGWIKKDGYWREIWPTPPINNTFLISAWYHLYGRQTIEGMWHIDASTPGHQVVSWGGSRIVGFYPLPQPRYRNINRFRILYHLVNHEGAWKHNIGFQLYVFNTTEVGRYAIRTEPYWMAPRGSVGGAWSPWFNTWIEPGNSVELHVGADYNSGDGVLFVPRYTQIEFLYEGD